MVHYPNSVRELARRLRVRKHHRAACNKLALYHRSQIDYVEGISFSYFDCVMEQAKRNLGRRLH